MGEFRLKVKEFQGGLNTSHSPLNLPLGQHLIARNIRYNDGTLRRRNGQVQLAVLPMTQEALSLVPGTDGQTFARIPLNLSVHQLPTRWTIDLTIQPTDIPVGDAVVLGFEDTADNPQPFKMVWQSDGVVSFTFTDSGGTAYTLASGPYAIDDILPVRVTRDGAFMTMWIDGTIAAARGDLNKSLGSITPTSDLIIGRSLIELDGDEITATSGEADFAGLVDELRIFHQSFDNHEHARLEWPDPRYPTLVAYYRMNDPGEATSDAPSTYIVDDSRFGNHGGLVGSCSFTAGIVAALAPVVGIHNFQAAGGDRKILITAGEFMYYSEV